MNCADPGIEWLLRSSHATVRWLTLTEVLDRPIGDADVRAARAQILEDPWVSDLLVGQEQNGGFRVHPYQKWTGAHWRLVSLVELGVPADEPSLKKAANQVLDWLTGKAHRSKIQHINGLTRRCASQEGNALAVCSRLGLSDDPRVRYLAASLIEWQWPDGGWNCDKNPGAGHSSFYESLAPLWGLIEYSRATRDQPCLQAAKSTAEFFLRHDLFRSETGGEVIDPEWLKLHYPLYWHYDILQALLILSRLGPLEDARQQAALDVIEQKRLPDGDWKPEGYFWYPPGKRSSNVEVVNWGRKDPNLMITLNALRVLKSAGRL
ncbi:MAG: hypothetical protein P8X95_03970 [Anaerolineales bacterium]